MILLMIIRGPRRLAWKMAGKSPSILAQGIMNVSFWSHGMKETCFSKTLYITLSRAQITSPPFWIYKYCYCSAAIPDFLFYLACSAVEFEILCRTCCAYSASSVFWLCAAGSHDSERLCLYYRQHRLLPFL